MKRIIILVTIFAFCLCGCSKKIYTWEFSQNISNVKEIKIIDIKDFKDEYEFSVIKEIDIDLLDELYSDITTLKMKKYVPFSLSAPGGLCFLIMFENGEYDIVAERESKSYRYDEEEGRIKAAYNSWLYCDEAEFEALINKYLEM